MNRPVLVRGGSVLDVSTARWLRDDVLLTDRRVAGRGAVEVPAGAQVLDATGLLVTPGLVDAQVNGAAGADLSREPERMAEVAAAMPGYGVTAFVPTIITAAAGAVEAALGAAAALPAGGAGARVVGVLGDQEVVLEGDVVRLADASGTLAGSGVGLDHCVRTLVAMTGCDPAEAFVAATRTPADLVGRPDLGRLDAGAAADVALWTPDLRLAGLVVAGRPVPVGAGAPTRP